MLQRSSIFDFVQTVFEDSELDQLIAEFGPRIGEKDFAVTLQVTPEYKVVISEHCTQDHDFNVLATNAAYQLEVFHNQEWEVVS